jgi:predicted nuclease of restriction endonuclease-like (RecB) superfamily
MAGKRAKKRQENAIVAQPARGIGQLPVAQLPTDYPAFLEEIKARIRVAQIKASLSVNRELIALYWDIGQGIVERQRAQGWGASVIDRLAHDIQTAFPGIEGFSPSNISRMRAFYLAYTEEARISARPVPKLKGATSAQAVPKSDRPNLPQPVREIPWGHNIVLLFKLKDSAQRLWYAQQTIANGWSRSMLLHWIESDLYSRQGKAVTNFKTTLPAPQSDLASELVKDPYNFDFLTLRQDAAERELEQGLLDHIRKFLLELGAGFAFVGQQVHLEVDGEDFYIDLLFYHLRLRCFIVIDLKVQPFKPEFAGKMNFYLSAADDLLRHPDDKPSIGLILCRDRNRTIAEYALRDLAKPVGVARYVTRLVESLPADLRDALPSVEQLQAELDTPTAATRNLRTVHPPAPKRPRRKPKDKGVGDGK